MKSKWFKLKPRAIFLRKKGYSLGKIESQLKIPRSTLNGWLKHVKLTEKQKNELLKNWKRGLAKARRKAAIWHKTQKEKRINDAKISAQDTVNNINKDDKNILELALAFLYLGEGSKNNPETALGSSNPQILKFFLSVLKKVYKIEVQKISCDLSLRADQDPNEMKKYWSKKLKIPLSCFKQAHIDKRTIGSPTYPSYRGVCNLRCGNIAVQRKLIFIADQFCKETIE